MIFFELLTRVKDSEAAVKHQEKWHMCIDKLFDISKKDIDKHLSAKDHLFIQDQKGLRKSTFGGKDLKQLKRQLSKEELITTVV